ncbi:MAG: 1-acyl-sn-glycerol-3-phosphate acyltransferase [Dysgonamonadaceae bacterium]|jgi:1-acyl-sn-glycerol-3-phosphate acyltransferase|nr:1-acyl-sn-glycerol-3-phosphate acyltransferase [Dysgonamonadaceae bacterium]
MRKLYTFLLQLVGWKSSMQVKIPERCVLCVAPHTSNWDFILGMLFYKSIGGKPHVLMKKEWFFFPINYFLRALGGIPVNREKKSSLSDQMARLFASERHFHLAIAPEGTRKKNINWKTGFYYIAEKAGVPVTLAYIDYAKKEIGIGKNFYPTGNLRNDIEEIKSFYKNIKGKHPNKFAIG